MLTALVTAIVLVVALVLVSRARGPWPDGREIARRPDWSDEQYRRAVDAYRKDQESLMRGRVQAGLWVVLAGLVVWILIQAIA